MKNYQYYGRKCINTAFLLGILAMSCVAQKNDLIRLDETIASELKETNTPGAVVAIVSGDRVVYAKAFGMANIETNSMVTTDMVFRIGSMTKMFTALTLLCLAEEGKIRLDEPVGNYVKELDPKIAQITFHQLLSHTSGLRDDGRPFGLHDESALINTVRTWKADFLFTEPGDIFSYSNLNYSLIGAAIEQVGGKPYADVMSERIFKPVGMSRTTFRPTEAMTFPLAQGHNPQRNAKPVVVRPFTDNVAGWPAGFMFSTANDLALFAAAFLNNGQIDGKSVMSAANIKKASAPAVEIPGIDSKYGYGLRIEETNGIPTVSHGGAIPGFGAQIMMAREQRFAIIVLANQSGARLEKTVDTAMALFLPVKPKVTADNQNLPIMTEEMVGLTGTYTHSARQFFEIVANEGKLFLKDEEDLLPMQKTGKDRFLYNRSNSATSDDLTFVTGANGKTRYLHLNGRAFMRKPE